MSDRARWLGNGSRILPIALLGLVGGCTWFGGQQQPRARLGSDAFYRSGNASAPMAGGEDRRQQADASGALGPGVVRGVAPDDNTPRVPSAQSSQEVRSISPAVQQAVQNPSTPTQPSDLSGPQPPTSSAPTTQGTTTAQYMTVGAVVTEVSGTPIYADKVIQQLAPLLSSEAKQRDFASYRALAQREIEKQVNLMIRTELEVAAAMQNLSKDEQLLAWNATELWRKRQITEAGGSEQLARRKAEAEGTTFDEKAREQYRTYLVQLFYQKKVYPKVQVTAEDMRRYYDQHVKTEFTEADQAQFRLIKITAQNMGGREQAIDKIKQLHDEAIHMDDAEFAKLAGSINHDPALMKSAGHVGGGDGWVQRGAFAITKVEDAVWKLQPGQVTDVMEVGNDSFYIARLENRKLGRVRPFEDEDVQRQISDTLKRAQIAARREQLQQKLLQNAVIYPYPPVIDPAVEIALQKYPQWAVAK